MSESIIEQLTGDEGQRERDVCLLLRAAWLLSQDAEYATDSQRGFLRRRTRLGLIELAGRLEGSRSEAEG
jgi:hypothetical protein